MPISISQMIKYYPDEELNLDYYLLLPEVSNLAYLDKTFILKLLDWVFTHLLLDKNRLALYTYN